MNKEQMQVVAELYTENDKLETQNKLLDKKLHELQQENNQLKQENQELINILKIIRKDINFVELCDGYIIEDKLRELEGEINEN